MKVITDDLYRRIKEGKQWFYSKTNTQFAGLICRNYPASATLVELYDNCKRVERFGLGFLIQVEAPNKSLNFKLDVRVKPDVSDKDDIDSFPYVSVYVLEQVSGYQRGDVIIVEHLTESRNYDHLASLETPDWYIKFIKKALDTEKGKMFSPDNQIKI